MAEKTPKLRIREFLRHTLKKQVLAIENIRPPTPAYLPKPLMAVMAPTAMLAAIVHTCAVLVVMMAALHIRIVIKRTA